MLTMGVDIGSTASKAVILEDGSRIVAVSYTHLTLPTILRV